MGVHVTVESLQSWAEQSKLDVTGIDMSLDEQLSTILFARLSGLFGVDVTSTWVDTSSTPGLIKTILAMQYISWQISRAYASDETESDYALRLLGMSETLITGLLDGTTVLIEIPAGDENNDPAFYPTDVSSAMCPTSDDLSLGGPAFSMGTVW